jgi:hypothetical protein
MASNKKKRGSSKKEKGSKLDAEATRGAPSSPLTLLRRMLQFWSAFAVAGFAVYVARGYQNMNVNGPGQRGLSSPSASMREQKYDGKGETTDRPLGEEESTMNEQEIWPPPDPRIEALVSQLCQEIHCHDSLQVVNRTFRATHAIPVGEKLFEIPRKLQIWDLDAYRDSFVRKHLFKASHQGSGNRPGSEAFLAAFLALELKRAEQYPSSFDPLRLTYFQSLPTYEEYLDYHPILQDNLKMREILGRSISHSVVQAYKNMVKSEFDAFVTASAEFQGLISESEYLRARLNVLTRVLNVGVPGPDEVMPGTFIGDEFENEDLLQDELHSYYDLIGVNLTEAGGRGCIAMIPLADLFNHHPRSNVQLEYKKKEQRTGRSFVVTSSSRTIDAYTEPMVSYGYLADAHVYARYGFINGDGSGPTQISLAFHHEVMKLNISSQYNYLPDTGTTPKFRSYQRHGVAKYLLYDDGYTECIPGPATHPDEAELKRLKLEHLIRMANDYARWNVLMPPRSPFSMPAKATDVPITLDTPQFYTNYTYLPDELDYVRETCRMISLTNDEFDGNAIQILRDNLENPNFVIGPEVSDALEFRSYMCLSRLFGTTVVTMELQGSLASEGQRVAELNRNDFGSKNWTAYHVRLGEMQALKAAAMLIFARVSESWEDKKVDPETEYTMRDESCPDEHLKYLFREEEPSPGAYEL